MVYFLPFTKAKLSATNLSATTLSDLETIVSARSLPFYICVLTYSNALLNLQLDRPVYYYRREITTCYVI